jgi:deoxyribose-phosphate aldolase
MSVTNTSPITNITQLIDHTWLPELPVKPEVDPLLSRYCEEAIKHGFAGVCVRPDFVAQCADLLQGSNVALAAVIGFPAKKVDLSAEWNAPTIGTAYVEDKCAEIAQVIADGATELDIVWDVGAFLTGADLGNTAGTEEELAAYVKVAGGLPIKLIIEVDLLPPKYIPLAVQLCQQAGVAMVKTSTGYITGGKGATEEALVVIKEALGEAYPNKVSIKASGGIRTPEQAEAMVEAGATRLGTSNGLALLG